MQYYMNDELANFEVNIDNINIGFYFATIEDTLSKEDYLCIYNKDNGNIKIFDNSFKEIFNESVSNIVYFNPDNWIYPPGELSPAEFYKNQIVYVLGNAIDQEKAKFDFCSMTIENGEVKKLLLIRV